jgi:hypothetical protein
MVLTEITQTLGMTIDQAVMGQQTDTARALDKMISKFHPLDLEVTAAPNEGLTDLGMHSNQPSPHRDHSTRIMGVSTWALDSSRIRTLAG